MNSAIWPTQWPWICTALAALLSLFFLINRRKKTTSQGLPPGPIGVPLLGSLPFLRSDLHRYMKELADVYGLVLSLRLGSKLCVVLSSPEGLKEVLKDNDAAFGNHDVPIAAAISFYDGRDIVWSPYGPYWRMIRKITVRELLNPTIISSLCRTRTAEVRRMEEKVLEMAGQPLDLRELVSKTAMRMMTEMVWGGSVAQEGERREDLEREFSDALEALLHPVGLPNVSDFFPALARLDLQGLARKAKKLLAWIDTILNRIIEQRLGMGSALEDKRFRDLLQVLLELMKNPDPQVPLTIEGVKGVVLDMLTGGTDTTTITVEWALAELLPRPDILKKAVEEIATVVGEGNRVEEADLPDLKYLDLVIKETLRLHPPLPFLIPRSPTGDNIIGGYRIPAGSRIFFNIWAIQRDPKLWYKASTFMPERFIGSEAGRDYGGSDFSYLPFGSGRRNCVGAMLGRRMVKFILASLLHSTDWEVPQRELAEWDLQDKFQSVLKKERPLVLIPIKRLHS